jgi:hypothetical protein
MRSRNAVSTVLLALAAGLLIGCHVRADHLFQVGTIISRAPHRVAHDSVPAMFVIDDTTFRRNACGHGTLFTFGPGTRVVREDGGRADTSALTLGRRVSVFVGDGTLVLESCPPITHAAKVVLH